MSENSSAGEDWKAHPLEHALAAAASYGHLYGPDLSKWPDFTLRQIRGFTDYYESSLVAPTSPAPPEGREPQVQMDRMCGCGALGDGEACPRPDGSLLCEDPKPSAALVVKEIDACIRRYGIASLSDQLMQQAADLLRAPAPVAPKERGGEEQQSVSAASFIVGAGAVVADLRRWASEGKELIGDALEEVADRLSGAASPVREEREREEAAAFMDERAGEHDRWADWSATWPHFGDPKWHRAAAARYRLAAAALRAPVRGEEDERGLVAEALEAYADDADACHRDQASVSVGHLRNLAAALRTAPRVRP
jgi:hypothetical protein